MGKNIPRSGLNGNAPGNYEIICRTNNTVVNPGESIKIEILITGYGLIPQAKLVFYPSGEILDINKSKVYSDLGYNKTGQIVWGVTENYLKNEGMTIGMSGTGLKLENWNEQTMFFDLTEDTTPIISTESIMFSHKPPFKFILKTNKKINSGNYGLHFVFTYFNGQEWKASNLTVNFTVRSILQRHEKLISWIAFIAAAISIISSIYSILAYYH